MSNFDKVIDLVLKNEGVTENNPTGFADIKGDPGGVTKWGISTKAWRGDGQFPGLSTVFSEFPKEVTELTKDQAIEIYRREYFKPWMESLDVTTAFLLFDCEVNQGLSEKIVQRAVGVVDDGVVGPNTLKAIGLANRDIPKFNEEIIWQRLMSYRTLAYQSDTFEKFLYKLWIPRLNSCRKTLKTL